MEVFFTSKETWDSESNVVRCHPDFYRNRRFESVMINTGSPERPLFARLLALFSIQDKKGEGKKSFPLALIVPYEGSVGNPQRQRDKNRGEFYRVCATKKVKPELVFARTIIRGAVLCSTYSTTDDYFVFDVLDSDMFLRVRELKKRLGL